MRDEIDWEERKRALCTVENLRRKIALFPDQDVEEIEALLNDAGQWSHLPLSFSILRCVDMARRAGDVEFLNRVVAVAREDHRDILIGEYLRESDLPFDASEEDEKAAHEDDAREYLDWIVWGCPP